MATEVDGILVGTPQIFLRFECCKVGCLNCDSMDTWEFKDDSHMSVESVLSQVYELAGHYPNQIKRVSITGGDPLHPKLLPGVVLLAKTLKKEGFFVGVEAAGTRVVSELFDVIDYINYDYKTPSTGVKTKLELIERMFEQYENRFQIKSVIADEADFNYTLEAYRSLQNKLPKLITNWVLTPCFEKGESFPQERFQKVIELNENAGGPFRVIGQQHKWIHGPDKTNV